MPIRRRPEGELKRDPVGWYGTALPLALIACFLIGLAIAVYVLLSWRDSMVRGRGLEVAALAAEVADRLDRALFERYAEVRLLAGHDLLKTGTHEQQTEFLHRHLELSSGHAWLGVTDARGQLQVSAGLLGGDADRSQDDWFLGVSQTGRAHLGRPQPVPEADGRLGVTFAAPISGPRGDLQGVVTGLVLLDHLRPILDGSLQDGAWLPGGRFDDWRVLDGEGLVLNEAGGSGRWGGHLAFNLRQAGLPSALLAANSEAGASGFIEETHALHAQPMVTGYARLPGYRDFLGYDWTVLVHLDRGRAYAEFDRLVWTVAGVALLVVAPLTGFGLWASRQLQRDIARRKVVEKRLDDLAYYDPLTGLPNRRLFLELLGQALARARRGEGLVAVLFLDLDRFKLVNDSLGHAVGDQLLKAVAGRLASCLRTTDTVSRLGGDEFTVILEDLSSSEDAARIAQKLLEAVAVPLVIEGHEIFVGASIGIALYPTDHDDRDALIKSADTAMYSAKEEGNAYRFYSADMNARAFERLTLETGLRHAVKREEFVLHYQPLVDFRSGTMVGVEALVRWQHPERGLLSPDKFIPLAEETGLIVPLGEWVLRTACVQTKAWQGCGYPQLRVAVNLSRRQFQQKNLVQTVSTVLADTGLDPRSLELELTESLLIHDAEGTIAMLHALHAMGIRLSIDDFGAEYSSLGYLKRLPINTLKIDQSFVRDIATSRDDASITKAIITLAHCLNLNVVAEGVETAGQVDFLRSERCNEMQGYYFSQALTTEALGRLLTAGGPVDFSRPSEPTPQSGALTSA